MQRQNDLSHDCVYFELLLHDLAGLQINARLFQLARVKNRVNILSLCPSSKGDEAMMVCNTATIDNRPTASASEQSLYLDSEHYIEAGSAYFSQAFGEVLGSLSELELHNIFAARLKLQSAQSLLTYAVEQYRTSLDFAARSGLAEGHEKKLREAGLDGRRCRVVLSIACDRGFLLNDEPVFELIEGAFDKSGYAGLMHLYINKVEEISELISTHSPIASDAVAWQELSWKLTSSFSRALEFGKAIAVLNIFSLRIPTTSFVSQNARGIELGHAN
jgi:hypothetical protein